MWRQDIGVRANVLTVDSRRVCAVRLNGDQWKLLYSSCILAVLLYACETWTLTKPDWKRLESFHLHCQRRILGIKWSDFITNAEVYTRSGLQSIQSIVHRRRLSLFGHVARMPDNVPAKAVLRMACDVRDGVPPFPNWRRLRGRSPTIPGCTRSVQTVVCQLEMPSTAPRIGPCGERTLRPPRPRVDDDDDDDVSRRGVYILPLNFFWLAPS